MEKLGKVIKVYIPEKYMDDPMNAKEIGFKVETSDELIDLIEEVNEYNSDIYKDDIVLIRKQVIDGKEYTSIELYDGEEYE